MKDNNKQIETALIVAVVGLAICGVIFFLASIYNAPKPTPVPKDLTWDSSLIPTDMVRIDIIRETSINPAVYNVYQTISTSTPNDGDYPPIPTVEGDIIQIGCPDNANVECHAILIPSIN